VKSFFHEIVAGLSTFFTMSYVLILCPEMLTAGGLEFGAAMSATIVTLAFGTLLLSLIAGYPVVVGPGLGIAAFLIFSIMGANQITISEIMGLVFWTGVLEVLLTFGGIRQKILLHIPATLKRAAPAGIGLFFIVVGLKQLELIQIANGAYSLGTIGTVGQTIGLFGLLLLSFLHLKKHRAAFLFPILFCWGLSLLFGISEWEGFFSLPPPLEPFKLNLWVILQPNLWTTLLSVLLIALFDAAAAITALARALGWIERDGSIRNINRVLIPDGVSSMLGAVLGTTSSTFYIESSSGIRAGGKTWIVGTTAALCALLSLFFYPALASIPRFATAPALIGLGALMASGKSWKEWENPTEWIPFIITALTMPLFFNIYLGIAFGFISYVGVKLVSGRRTEIHPLVWGLAAIFVLHLLIFYCL
jgi:AGZA family xanthine/uracil permease-like MFS transporter